MLNVEKRATRVKRGKTYKRCQEQQNNVKTTQLLSEWSEHVTLLFKPIGELGKLTTKGDTR